jgi:hypothetical protein
MSSAPPAVAPAIRAAAATRHAQGEAGPEGLLQVGIGLAAEDGPAAAEVEHPHRAGYVIRDETRDNCNRRRVPCNALATIVAQIEAMLGEG